MNEYLKTFLFGLRLIVLLPCLALPLMVGSMIQSWIDNISQKSSLLYVPELKITAIQDFEPTSDSNSWRKIGLTSGKTIHFKTSRPIDLLSKEWEQTTDEVIDLINNEYSVKRIPIKDKDTQEQKGIIYIIPDYSGTAVYGRHTKLGSWLVTPITIALFVVCLAAYFPLVRAIINLFRRRSVSKSKAPENRPKARPFPRREGSGRSESGG